MRTLVLSSLVATGSLIAQAPQPKMGAPLVGLTSAQAQRFHAGRADFTHVFTAQEGLGPIFNQSSCGSCHNNPVGGPGSQTVTRFGFTDGKGLFDPLASLGGSLLQAQAIAPACQEVVPPAANTTSLRVTTSTLGIGLIEAIPDAAIAARESNPPSPNVSGRVHWVQPLESPTGPLRAGRFGWKAQVATVLSFSGDASKNELGFTNRLDGQENAPNGNLLLLQQWDAVADPEDHPDANNRDFLDRITDYQRFLAAPPQTPRSGLPGEALFAAVGCADCHTPSYVTANDPALEPALRNKTIRPYSDFLLHDMGIAADFIEQGAATGNELRTPPLWGVRNRDPLWHDGRIVGGTLQTRILGPNGVIAQHAAFGSEAAPSAAAFQALSTTDKQRVVDFLDSLGRAEFDWNGDNALDQVDLAAFRQAYAGIGGPWPVTTPQAVFDFNQDGWVTQADLIAFAQVYEGDCDHDLVNDLLEVVTGTAADSNQDLVPDRCQTCQPDLGYAGAGTLAMSTCGDPLTIAGSRATFELTGGVPFAPVLIAIGIGQNPHLVTATEYLVPFEPLAALVTLFSSDPSGKLRIPVIGGAGANTTWVFQAATFDGVDFDLSNALSITVGAF